MGRAPCCDKATVKKGPWAAEEDALLRAHVAAHGTGENWIALPRKIGLNRCGKSCRLRWLNYLRPNIRHGGFTDDEDRLICSLYASIGSRWSTIAAQLPGRTDNDVKNYWNTKLKRRQLGGGRRPLRYALPLPQPQPRLILASPTGYGAASSALERMQLSVQRRHGIPQETTPGSFTFYGSLATPPWQTQQSPFPAASTNYAETSTASGYSGLWSHVQTSAYTGSLSVQDQGASWDSSGGGITPLSTSTTGEAAAGIDSSSSTPAASSVTFGGDMEDEIDMLLRQIRSLEEDDGGQMIGLGEMAAAADGSAGSWSSCSTPGVDSVFQDYVQQGFGQ